MNIIRDAVGRTICMTDPNTGEINIKYRQIEIIMKLSPGDWIEVKREGITTTLIQQEKSLHIIKNK